MDVLESGHLIDPITKLSLNRLTFIYLLFSLLNYCFRNNILLYSDLGNDNTQYETAHIINVLILKSAFIFIVSVA